MTTIDRCIIRVAYLTVSLYWFLLGRDDLARDVEDQMDELLEELC